MVLCKIVMFLSSCFGEYDQVWNRHVLETFLFHQNRSSPLVQTVMKIVGQKDDYNIQSLASTYLSFEYELLPSGSQYRAQRCELNRLKNSSVPESV